MLTYVFYNTINKPNGTRVKECDVNSLPPFVEAAVDGDVFAEDSL